MFISFYIPESKLEELKFYIDKELLSAKYYNTPFKSGNEYSISLTLELDDLNKLNLLLNKWKKENASKEEKMFLSLQEVAKKLRERK